MMVVKEQEDELVGTIRDDDEVSDSDESSDEEGNAKIKAAGKTGKSDETGMTFFDGLVGGSASKGGTKQHAWDLTMAIRAAAPLEKYRSSVEDKIARRRLNKKREADVAKENRRTNTEEEEEEMSGEGEGENEQATDDEDEGDKEEEQDESEEGSSESDEDDPAEERSQRKSKHGQKKAAKKSKAVSEEGDISEPEDKLVVKKEAKRGKAEKLVPFEAMHLSRPLLKAIQNLEWEHATPIQAKTIPLVLAGRDLCGSAVTGSGKTAAFVLPVLERLIQGGIGKSSSTRVLILLPTRELAVQCHAVVTSLCQFTRIRSGLAVGGLSNKAQEIALRARPEVLVATPGRLIDHIRNAHGITLDDVEILIMDEADRLLEMGFRDEVEEIVKWCPGKRQSLLFSATMTSQVQWLVKLSLRNAAKVAVDPKFDVAATLSQEFVRMRGKTESNRDAVLLSLVKRSFHTKVIIFFTQKHVAHRFRIIFGLLGLNAAELHGNLTQAQRLTALQQFRDSTVDFLLCTDLAARGLDIIGVQTVINYEMPKTITEYVHRVGRTARAGAEGKSVSIVGETERKLLREIHRRAKDQLSSRKIAANVIDRWRKKIDRIQSDIEDVLKEERREKELRMADIEVQKAENMIKHDKEILSRPKRTWFQTSSEKEAARESQKKRGKGKEGTGTEEGRKRTRGDRWRDKAAKARAEGKRQEREKEESERLLSNMLAKRARKQKQQRQRNFEDAMAPSARQVQQPPQKKSRKKKF